MEEIQQSFWAMGGYGPYVWPVYGIALVFFVASAFFAVWSLRRAQRRLQTLEQETRAP